MISLSHWLRVVPLVPIALLAVAVAAQSGCSSEETALDDAEDSRAALGCRASEVLRTVNGKPLCCSDIGNAEVRCVDRNSAQADETCEDEGATVVAGDVVSVTRDSCVSEDCAGDATSTDYAAETALVQSSVTCVERNGSRTWQREGAVREQLVTRVCNNAQTTACTGVYGYGYSGRAATTREVTILASTCRVGDAAAVDCPAGSL